MANELVIIERQLQAVEPRLHSALGGLMPSKRLIQTVLVSCERTPRLLACRPQSILNGAMTFAVLGLPVDGTTGQGFLLPFKEIAQPCIGYKGYNTLGARASLTITGAAVREDDHLFDYLLGDKAFVQHKPRLGSNAKIIAFWSVAAALDRPPIISILSMSDVMSIKDRSPARAKVDSPWNDPHIGFVAMGEKSAKRRLARSTPLITEAPQFMLGARMEEAFEEQGKASWIQPERGVVVEGDYTARPTFEPVETPTAQQLISPPVSAKAPAPPSERAPSDQGGAGAVPDWQEYVERWDVILDEANDAAALRGAWSTDFHKRQRREIIWPERGTIDPDPLDALTARVTRKISDLKAA